MNTLEQKAVIEIHTANIESKELAQSVSNTLEQLCNIEFNRNAPPTFIQVNVKDIITISDQINEIMVNLVNSNKWSMALLNQNNDTKNTKDA